MKPSILLLAFPLAIAFGSCTTAYKTGQTPDDVYYSPVSSQDEYVRAEQRNNRYDGATIDEYYDDRYLRMKVNNRYRWNELDEWYNYGNRYEYSYYNYNHWNHNAWSPSLYWNSFYNPYYHGIVVINPKNTMAYSGPRRVNLNSFSNNAFTVNNFINPKTVSGTSVNDNGVNRPRTFSNSYNNSADRNNGNTGSFLRNIFNNNNNSNNNSTQSNNNSSSTPRSSSSSSSSESGSTAPVRRF